MEEGESGALWMNAEEVKLFSQFPVISCLGFFHTAKIFLELFLRSECCPVYACQHFVLLIAVPVGTGE